MILSKRNGNSHLIGRPNSSRSSLMVAMFFKQTKNPIQAHPPPLKKLHARVFTPSITSFVLLDQRGVSADCTPRPSKHEIVVKPSNLPRLEKPSKLEPQPSKSKYKHMSMSVKGELKVVGSGSRLSQFRKPLKAIGNTNVNTMSTTKESNKRGTSESSEGVEEDGMRGKEDEVIWEEDTTSKVVTPEVVTHRMDKQDRQKQSRQVNSNQGKVEKVNDDVVPDSTFVQYSETRTDRRRMSSLSQIPSQGLNWSQNQMQLAKHLSTFQQPQQQQPSPQQLPLPLPTSKKPTLPSPASQPSPITPLLTSLTTLLTHTQSLTLSHFQSQTSNIQSKYSHLQSKVQSMSNHFSEQIRNANKKITKLKADEYKAANQHISLRVVGCEERIKYACQEVIEGLQEGNLFRDEGFIGDKQAGEAKATWIHLNDLYEGYAVMGKVLQPIMHDTNNTFAKTVNVLIKVYPEILKRLFEESCPEKGVYCVWLSLNGKFAPYVIDGFVPFTEKLEPLFTEPSRKQLWGTLLEKAMAKALGGYKSISNLSVADILSMLSGVHCQKLSLRSINPKQLQQILQKAQQKVNKLFLQDTTTGYLLSQLSYLGCGRSTFISNKHQPLHHLQSSSLIKSHPHLLISNFNPGLYFQNINIIANPQCSCSLKVASSTNLYLDITKTQPILEPTRLVLRNGRKVLCEKVMKPTMRHYLIEASLSEGVYEVVVRVLEERGMGRREYRVGVTLSSQQAVARLGEPLKQEGNTVGN